MAILELWPDILGYAVAMLGPLVALVGISALLWKHIAFEAGAPAKDAKKEYRGYLPAFLGVIERFLYVTTIVVGHPEFVGVWLVLKVAGGWKGWSEGQVIEYSSEVDTHSVRLLGRDLLNTSLIGSALSLIWAIVGVAVIAAVSAERYDLVIFVVLAATIGTYGFWFALAQWWQRRTSTKDGEAPVLRNGVGAE